LAELERAANSTGNHSAQLQTELSSLRLTLDQQMTDLVAKSSKYYFVCVYVYL